MRFKKGFLELVLGGLNEDLSRFWSDRQNRIYNEDLCGTSKNYSSSEKEAFIIYEALRKNLSEEQRKQLMELVDAKTSMELASNSLFYKQGCSDGIKIILHLIIG